MSEKIHDLIIIGGGPAGLSAGLYAGRSKLDTILLERGALGGQMSTTDEVENYPGSIHDATGPKLVERMKEQAIEFGVQILNENVNDVELDGDIKVVKTTDNVYKSKAVILSMGVKPRLAGFKNELEFRSRGVSYCATCDGAFFEDLDVAVVGGGDSAISEALFLTRFAKSIRIIHRRKEFRAAKYLIDRAMQNPKIEFILDSVIEEANGSDVLEKLVIKNCISGEKSELAVDGCFVFVGLEPINELVVNKVNINEQGYIVANENMEININGVYAVGDIRVKEVRQIVTAAADGAIGAIMAEKYIERL